MVVVASGTFVMGSPEDEAGRTSAEGPQHTVSFPSSFAAGKYEVMFAEWDACVDDGGCSYRPRDPGWGRGRRPVVNVSWSDITDQFLPWLSRRTGHAYRLLTEAEWEYAARAGTATPFATGATISAGQANFDATFTYGGSAKGAFLQRTTEAGSYAPNAFGLYDMHGNVWEWVQDCTSDSYDKDSNGGRSGNATADCPRIMRGGSWIDAPRVLRSAYRSSLPPQTRFIYRGFRVARSLD